MIKEKKGRNRKVDKKKLFIKELVGYLRTTFIAFCVALIFTLLLAFHARSEMIKNLYVNKEEQYKIEQKIAKQIVAKETTFMPFVIAAIFYYVFNLVVAFVMRRIEKKLDYY